MKGNPMPRPKELVEALKLLAKITAILDDDANTTYTDRETLSLIRDLL